MRRKDKRSRGGLELAPALVAIGCVLIVPRQGLAQEWIQQFGTTSPDYPTSLIALGSGDIIMTGTTGSSLGGPSAGNYDPFLARYNSDGNQLWITQFGSTQSDMGTALAPAPDDGVYVGGYTYGVLAGTGAGNWDAFLARYDAQGSQIWIRQFGGERTDRVRGLAPDMSGGVYVCAWTSANLGGPSNGQIDGYLARYDSAGNRLWGRQIGTPLNDYANALASDGVGGVYVTGETKGDLAGANAGSMDVFLARYDGSGTQLWIRQFGTDQYDRGSGLARDGAGGVFVCGVTRGSLGAPNAGETDGFIAWYDSMGNQLWIDQFGTPGVDGLADVTTDTAGDVIVTGYSAGSAGGPNSGEYDAMVVKYSRSGERLWIRQFGTEMRDYIAGVVLIGTSGMLVCGATRGALGGPNSGEEDVFLARIEEPCAADCDHSTGRGVLDVFDFLCFQNSFVLGHTFVCDCDTSTGSLVCDIFDFLCFQNAFIGGCP